MPETDQARKGGRSSPQHPSRSAPLKSLDLSLATRQKKFEMMPNCESQARQTFRNCPSGTSGVQRCEGFPFRYHTAQGMKVSFGSVKCSRSYLFLASEARMRM